MDKNETAADVQEIDRPRAEDAAVTNTTEEDKAIKSYHFSVGNSTTGPVGFAGCIHARSGEAALEILLTRLDLFSGGVRLDDDRALGPNDCGIEYLRAYFNPLEVTTADIDSVDITESTNE